MNLSTSSNPYEVPRLVPQDCIACRGPNIPSSPPCSTPLSSPSLSPTRASVRTESTAETDDDSVFPLTPNSQRTGSIERIIDTSVGTGSLTPSRQSPKQRHTNSPPFHPYRRPSSVQERHIFDSMLDRTDDDLPETMTSKTEDIGDILLQHMDDLGPHGFRLIVHYKEAVRERQRMRLYTTYWEAEENNRRGTLLHFLYQDAGNQFIRAEQQSRALLNKALEKHSQVAIASDAKFLTAVCDRNKAYLHRTDIQLDRMKDHIKRSQLFGSSVDDSGQKSDVAGDFVARHSPVIIHA
ncbi:hypothetical protein BDR07DRAFT_1487641 [Suillus spraguei]|nr:hypothetical protein BDR07DRAFT_1488562 [Suillus spraguei]KAG2359909.1 hypothetical protein BDR07DRAFT_1487641 [Suillus spraguei]